MISQEKHAKCGSGLMHGSMKKQRTQNTEVDEQAPLELSQIEPGQEEATT